MQHDCTMIRDVPVYTMCDRWTATSIASVASYVIKELYVHVHVLCERTVNNSNTGKYIILLTVWQIRLYKRSTV